MGLRNHRVTHSLVFAFSILALLGAIICMAPGKAFADSGDVAFATSDGSTVSVINENTACWAEGCPWAYQDFTRSNKGSNRAIDGAYRGYTYSTGTDADRAVLVASSLATVIHLPATTAFELGIDVTDPSVQSDLFVLFDALDQATAAGGMKIDATAPLVVTTETTLTVDSVTFSFGQKFSSDRFYACIIGPDGADPVASGLVTLSHAESVQIVSADALAKSADPSVFDETAAFFSKIDYSPLWVTLKTTGVAIVIIFILGLLFAWATLHLSPRAQSIADALLTIPMVVPPTVVGFLLLLCLGSNTALGRWFDEIGFPLVFSWPATVIAAVVVALPLMYRSARGAFENLDGDMLDAARTLGWKEHAIFTKLMIPLAWPSIAAGTVLAFARALGEFGATLFLAGNYIGITRTIPIAIYFEWMSGNTDVALFWTAVVLVLSFIVILFINLWNGTGRKRKRGK